MRLIDVEPILNGAEELSGDNPLTHVGISLNALRNAPVVDAKPVVRCKDCIYHGDEEPGMVYCPNIVGGWVEEDFFCKRGIKEV